MNEATINKAIEIAYAICPENRINNGSLRSSHVACLVKQDKIVKIGWNKNRTHPKTKKFPYVNYRYSKFDVGIHAELDVVLKAGVDDLSKYSIVVLRVDGNGKLNSSRPCRGCMSVLQQVGIAEIYYSDATGKVTKENG